MKSALFTQVLPSFYGKWRELKPIMPRQLEVIHAIGRVEDAVQSLYDSGTPEDLTAALAPFTYNENGSLVNRYEAVLDPLNRSVKELRFDNSQNQLWLDEQKHKLYIVGQLVYSTYDKADILSYKGRTHINVIRLPKNSKPYHYSDERIRPPTHFDKELDEFLTHAMGLSVMGESMASFLDGGWAAASALMVM